MTPFAAIAALVACFTPLREPTPLDGLTLALREKAIAMGVETALSAQDWAGVILWAIEEALAEERRHGRRHERSHVVRLAEAVTLDQMREADWLSVRAGVGMRVETIKLLLVSALTCSGVAEVAG